MRARITQMRDKEVIDAKNGCRYGRVGDIELDLEAGRVLALVVPGRLRWLGLLGREKERVFPVESVRCFGEEIILVEGGDDTGLP